MNITDHYSPNVEFKFQFLINKLACAMLLSQMPRSKNKDFLKIVLFLKVLVLPLGPKNEQGP